MGPGMVARTHLGVRKPRKMLKLELGQGSSEAPDQTHEKSLLGKRQQVLPSLRTVEAGDSDSGHGDSNEFPLNRVGEAKKCKAGIQRAVNTG